VLPLRTNFSHTGKLAVAPARKVLGAPAVGRVMNSMPPSGLTSRTTSAAPDDLAVAPHWLPDVVERIDGPPDSAPAPRTLKTPVDDTDASPAHAHRANVGGRPRPGQPDNRDSFAGAFMPPCRITTLIGIRHAADGATNCSGLSSERLSQAPKPAQR
jgi:hypothetical protein